MKYFAKLELAKMNGIRRDSPSKIQNLHAFLPKSMS